MCGIFSAPQRKYPTHLPIDLIIAQFGQFKAFSRETSRYPNDHNINGAPDTLLLHSS